MRFDSDPAQPLPPLRRAVVVAGSKATKVILAMLGVWVRVRGWDNMESGRRQHAVVIFNHVSFVRDVHIDHASRSLQPWLLHSLASLPEA